MIDRYRVKYTKNKKNGKAPMQVVLKERLIKEGDVFTPDMLLCPDIQLENLLKEEPCRIEKITEEEVLKSKNKASKKGNKK